MEPSDTSTGVMPADVPDSYRGRGRLISRAWCTLGFGACGTSKGVGVITKCQPRVRHARGNWQSERTFSLRLIFACCTPVKAIT